MLCIIEDGKIIVVQSNVTLVVLGMNRDIIVIGSHFVVVMGLKHFVSLFWEWKSGGLVLYIWR